MAALQAAGVPAADQLEPGPAEARCLGGAEGPPRTANAMKFIAFSTMAIPQARVCRSLHPLRLGQQRVERIHPARNSSKVLPSAPAIKSQLVPLQLRLVDR